MLSPEDTSAKQGLAHLVYCGGLWQWSGRGGGGGGGLKVSAVIIWSKGDGMTNMTGKQGLLGGSGKGNGEKGERKREKQKETEKQRQ